MKISRLERILRLITTLQLERTHSPDELAEELAVSRRTIFRDLNLLYKAGIPYYYDEQDHGYKIDTNFFLPPLNLKVEEALALLLVAHQYGGKYIVPLQKHAHSAALKIEIALPGHVKRFCGSILKTTSMQPTAQARHEDGDETFTLLQRAIRGKNKVKINYKSFYEKGDINTVLHPYHLHFGQRAWYVIGHSEMHRSVRMFKVSRIKEANVLKSLYLHDKPFDINAYLGQAWALIPEGKLYRVKLRFSEMVASNVAEVLWHDTQKLTRYADGILTFEAQVDGLNEISWWIMGYGDQVEVRAPAALRHRVAGMAQRMVALHQEAH